VTEALVTYVKVASIERRRRQVRARKRNSGNAQSEIDVEYEDLGYVLTIAEWHVALCVGEEPPPFEVGDRLKLTLAKAAAGEGYATAAANGVEQHVMDDVRDAQSKADMALLDLQDQATKFYDLVRDFPDVAEVRRLLQ
jgi:hypothetical protein